MHNTVLVINMFKMKIELSEEETRQKMLEEKQKKPCGFCGNLFTPKRIDIKYCSDKCRIAVQREYARKDMLRRRYGKKFSIRKEIIKNLEEIAKRQQFEDEIQVIDSKCFACGSKENLIEHHIRYIPEEKIILCTKCHIFLHKCILNGQKCRPKIVKI